MTTQKEKRVARIDDIADGSLMAFELGDKKLVLARVGDQFYALDGECPHQGAPLAEGLLCGKRLMCPWHHACFEVTTGELLEPPAPEGLAHYPVRVADGAVYVSDEAEEAEMTAQSDEKRDERTFVIVGGGAAGAACADELHLKGFTGRIMMFSRDSELPVDRTTLSKEYLNEEMERDDLFLGDKKGYREQEIEVETKRTVTGIDLKARTISFDKGKTQHYDALLLAPGSEPLPLDVPGSGLDGVLLLRTLHDADKLLKAAKKGKKAVVVGSSFIGMEVAAGLRKQKVDVAVVSQDKLPFINILGGEIGMLYKQLHEKHGVKFYLDQQVARIEGDKQVERVVLKDGTTLDADFVLVGIGVRPATDGIAGLTTDDDGGVTVDATMCLADCVYAAGDIARFPVASGGDPVRVEHWRVAQQHGRRAADAMLGHPVMPIVPLFWTNQYDLSLQYVGHASTWDATIIWGDIAKSEFLCFYLVGKEVRAVAASQRDLELDIVEELFRQGRMPSASELRKGPFDLAERLVSEHEAVST